MKRFVSIWFPYLATDWFTRYNPGLAGQPFVLKGTTHGRMTVTAANAHAAAKGIYPGMVLADARAIFPSLEVLDDKPGLTEKLLRKIAEWCIRFTPLASVDPFGGIILDASGCTHLWGSEQEYLTDIARKLQVKGYHARTAIADTIGAAWAMARYRNKSCIVHRGKHTAALLPLPPACLRLDTITIERLHKLGLHQVKDIMPLPVKSLRRRFGPGIVRRLHQALGSLTEYIEPVIPPEPYQERLPCIDAIRTRRGIEIALEQLLTKLIQRLNTEGKGIRSVVFRCYRVDGKEESITVSTTAATTHIKHLLHLFDLKISSLDPGLGIELFVLDACKTEDATGVQPTFWITSGDMRDNRVAEFADKVTGKFGTGVIHRFLPSAHYWPERSYREASFSEQPSVEWQLQYPRPIILLTEPELIEVTAPVPDYPPMMFRYKGRLHKVARADGPERIEQEWWIQNGQHRDYYTIEDETGCRYWLFRLGHYDAARNYKWFIHGFFA